MHRPHPGSRISARTVAAPRSRRESRFGAVGRLAQVVDGFEEFLEFDAASARRGLLPAGTRPRCSSSESAALRPQSKKPRAKFAIWCAATSPNTPASSSSKSGCACCSSSRNRCATSASPAMRIAEPRNRSSAPGPTSDSNASGVPASVASASPVMLRLDAYAPFRDDEIATTGSCASSRSARRGLRVARQAPAPGSIARRCDSAWPPPGSSIACSGFALNIEIPCAARRCRR